MLVMSRKEGEEILIGNNIRIMLVRIEGDKVRIGVTAPHDVAVHRKEVYDKIQQQKGGASDSGE